MTDSRLTSGLLKTGTERLALLGKHAAVLMQAYLTDEIDESAISEQAIKKLVAARILWRPDEQQGLKLRHAVRDLIAEMLVDESRRQVNADVAETLQQLDNQVMAFREAQNRGDYLLAEQFQLRLTQTLDDFNSRLSGHIHSLWHRLNTDFGFVSSLNDKIRENERAQQQISRLLDGLDLIDFDRLIELTQTSGPLRKLLVSQLQKQVSAHYGSLREVQARMLQLMARFRRQQASSLLVHRMSRFLRQHPGFQPGNYALRTQVPVLFNQAEPLKIHAFAALDRSGDADILAQLVQQLPRRQGQALALTAASPVHWPQDEQVAARQQALKQAVEDYYLAVIDGQAPASALAYLEQKQLDWPPEIWLFQVIAEHQGLPLQQKRLLALVCEEAPASQWNEVRIIADVHLTLRPAKDWVHAG